jgi:hypothetical protein
VGRVCCDSNGRLNAKSLIIESFGGKTVPLDISQVDNFSLFPGQVIVVEGENPLGSKLSAKQIYTDASLPLPPKPTLSTEENGKHTCSDHRLTSWPNCVFGFVWALYFCIKNLGCRISLKFLLL